MARELRVDERHAQPLHDRKASSGSAPSSRATRRSPFDADHPELFAAEDKAPTPVELVLSGLASCLTAGIAAVAQRRGIQLHSVKATLEADMDMQGILGIDDDVRNGFDGIQVHFDIDADASQDDIKALVAQSQKRSAVFDIITNPTNVVVDGQLTAALDQGASVVMLTTTVIIGAGHSGLAMSRHLTDRSIDHVVLERGEVANSWRTERWDSLRLLTPNWQSRLPGYAYEGDDPDGYMTMPEVVALLERYAERRRAPGHDRHARDARAQDGRRLRGRDRPGRLALPRAGDRQRRLQHRRRSALARGLPPDRRQPDAACSTATRDSCRTAACMSSARRRPACSSPDEIQALRPPRRALASASTCACRGSTAAATSSGGWTPSARWTSATTRSRTSTARARLPSPQLVGTPERATLDLNACARSGVEARRPACRRCATARPSSPARCATSARWPI